MKTNYFALLDNKIVYVQDVPKQKAVYPSDFKEYTHYNEEVTKVISDYNIALQSAIANGVEVENQDEVRGRLGKIYDRMAIRPELMPLQCRAEKEEYRRYITESGEWTKWYRLEPEWVNSEQHESKVLVRITFDEQVEKKVRHKEVRIEAANQTTEAMNQQSEQNKTVEDFLKKKFKTQYAINLPAIGSHALISIIEEYASQQTASLQKQHEEESVKLVRIVQEQYQKYIKSLKKELEKKEIELSNYAYQINSAKRDRDNAYSTMEDLKKQLKEKEIELSNYESKEPEPDRGL